MSQPFEEMKKVVAGLQPDIDKFYGKGNAAAGIRVRHDMQVIKGLANLIRKEIQEKKKKA
jgi:hypothetical protein